MYTTSRHPCNVCNIWWNLDFKQIYRCYS